MNRITLAVTGSIAAYKAADLTSTLIKAGYQVRVIMTEAATHFITPLTLQVLSRHSVSIDGLAEPVPNEIAHIELAKTDLFVVAPASANTLAKLAHGLADNLLTTTALALAPGVKKILAPAMNTNMYQQPITQHNLSLLKKQGYTIIEPQEESLLACGAYGKGALAPIQTILSNIKETFHEKTI